MRCCYSRSTLPASDRAIHARQSHSFPMTLELSFVAPAIILAAYTVSSAVGFGSALIYVPVLAQFHPLTFVLPLGLTLDLAAMLIIGVGGRRDADMSEIKRMVPFVLIGIVIGLTLLTNLPQKWMLLGLGLFIVYIGVSNLKARTHRPRISARWGAPTGLAGGVVTALYNLGGAVFTSYLSRRIDNPTVFRSTMSILGVVSGLFRLAAFFATGLMLHQDLPQAILWLGPFMLLGVWLGGVVRKRIRADLLIRCISVLLVGSGVSVLARAVSH